MRVLVLAFRVGGNTRALGPRPPPTPSRGLIICFTMKSTSYCFTINNYSNADENLLKDLPYKYIVYGREVGESGTPHLQGYVEFHSKRHFSAVKKLHTTAHWEIRKGTAQQAAEYCKKDNDFFEDGVISMSKAEQGRKGKEFWDDVRIRAEAGDIAYIKENYPKVWISHRSTLESLYAPTANVIQGELSHEWWVGDTGTGKSRALWRLYPDHFEKPLNKWWDNYRHESVVAIEEWCPSNACTASALKRWADRYPFTGEIKGGTLQRLRPQKIIVLSNYTIEECFPMMQDQDPIKRRFKVFKFPEDLDAVNMRAHIFHQATPAEATTEPELTAKSQEDGDLDLSLPNLNLDYLWDDYCSNFKYT